MIEITEELKESAYKLLSDGTADPVGYRVMVMPLEARQGLEGVEMGQFPTLQGIAEELGTELQTKTDDQADRETKGSDVGILLAVGPESFKRLRTGVVWAEPGDVVIFHRYAGHDIEFPPGSGNWIKVLNDEDLMGRIQ